MGIEGATGAAYYKGLIDEAALYNRALSASEIQGIYSAGSLGKCGTDPLPYQASGYLYQVLDAAASPATGFEQPSFDDSAWSVGDAGFGFSVGYCPLQATVRTVWPLNTRLLVRRVVSLPAGTSNVRVMVAVDNDIADVFFNGVRISTPQEHGDCPSLDNYRFDVPQSLIQPGQNLVVYHLLDRGGESFFDTRILAGVPQ